MQEIERAAQEARQAAAQENQAGQKRSAVAAAARERTKRRQVGFCVHI